MKNFVKLILFPLLMFSFSFFTSISIYASEISGVTVKYLDEATGKEIYPRNHLDEIKGSRYDVTSKKYKPTIPGYSLANVPTNVKGIVKSNSVEVCYYYKKCSKKEVLNKKNFNKQKNAKAISWMPDPMLAQYVADSLGIDIDDLTEETMKDLTVLQIYGGVTNLTGLEHATKLRAIEFYENGEMPDFTPLLGLTNLKEFVSQGNNLTNEKAEKLKKLPNSLQYLYFEEERQLSFDIFASFPNLINVDSLGVVNCGVTDLNFLEAYSTLKNIILNLNNLESASFDVLGKFNLEHLELEATNLDRLEKLPNFSRVATLNLRNNAIQDFSLLKNKFKLSNLRFINLDSINISSIDVLSELGNSLEFLSLDNNMISDLSPLKNTSSVAQINCVGQHIVEKNITIPYTKKYNQKNIVKNRDGSYVPLLPDTTFHKGLYDDKAHEINWTVSSEDNGELKSTWKIGEETDLFKYSGSLTIPYTVGEVGKVIVKYISELNNKEIHESQTILGSIDDEYDVSTDQYKLDLSSEGYDLDQDKLPTNIKGTFSKNDVEVVYYYKVAPINLINGSFELPAISGVWLGKQDLVPGWSTTATDKTIEIHRNGAIGVYAKDGYQYAELNANQVSALYQDIVTVPGEKIYWKVSHRGRMGLDTAIVEFGDPAGVLVKQQEMKDGNGTWRTYEGYYVVPDGQKQTRFQFHSVSAAGGNSAMGNFLDDVVFTNIQSKITIHFVDENGNKIKDSKEIMGFKGQEYDWSNKNEETKIDDYELDQEKMPSNVKGTFTEKDQEITLIYKPTVEATGYIEVPQKIHLHRAQENDKEYVVGKGTVQYHSIDGANDRDIEIFTDTEVTLTSKIVDEDEKEESVNVQVYHSDNSTLIEKDKRLGEVSKTNVNCDFYLKTLKKHFTKTNCQYEGKMTFRAKFK